MKKYIMIILFTGIVFSCDERFDDLNTSKKDPANVPGETLFANGMREMFDQMTNANVNQNVFRLYAQYWAQATYPEESQYSMVGRRIPDNIFTVCYRDALKDMTDGRKVVADNPDAEASAATNANRLAIMDIFITYTYMYLVDIFGDVPYSQALDPDKIAPAYDDARGIYDNLIAGLNTAINTLDVSADGITADQDPVYHGDVTGWLKFANSMKLRMAMMLADVDAAKSKSMVSEALASGVISSPGENTAITYQSGAPNTNALYEDLVISGRKDFLPANTLVDVMNGFNDPRGDVYFSDPVSGAYLGAIYGDANSYAAFSHIGSMFYVADLPGTIMTNSQVLFLLAEAAARGYSVPKSAEEYYNEAILTNMEEWGVDAGDAAAYLAQPEVAYTTADGGSGDWKQIIGIQAWIGSYNRGFEGWTLWRRLDFTAFAPPPDLTYADIPVRLIYPINEATLNGDNVKAAGAKIGGDSPSTKLFWDKF